MKLKIRDLIATVLVAAIGVPYIGYLINDEMPFIKDPRGMSAVGLILGAIAFLVLRTSDQVGKVTTDTAIVSLVLGIVALVFAEAAVADLLLAVFMGSILFVWASELIDRSGLMRSHGDPSGLTHV